MTRCAVLLASLSTLIWPLAAAAATPTLRVQAFVPFTVFGAHFRPFERVKVTLQGTWVRRTKASAAGRFVATFRGIQVDVCDGFVVRAVGSKGSVALRRAPPRECASHNPG